MIIGIKDFRKLFAITVVSCCAVFVCALFLNYNADIVGVREQITAPQAKILYDAQIATGKVVVGVSGGCLAATTAVLLIFYVKNYIDAHAKELGILKALGYARGRVAKHFWVFGISVFLGLLAGYIGALAYMPTFYKVQNHEGLLPSISPQFQPWLAVGLIVLPTVCFMALAVLYAFYKMNSPVLSLLKEIQAVKVKAAKEEGNDLPFLSGLRKSTLQSRKTLAFLIGFSAFCFSSMTQMSISMNDLASESFAWMILSIGLILAFMTLFMSLTGVIKANGKAIAMMKVFGYCEKECSYAILGGYRPISYIGFAIGTVYQYLLLRIMVDIVFSDFAEIPKYEFDFAALGISLAAFIVTYEVATYLYARRITKLPIQSVMSE